MTARGKIPTKLNADKTRFDPRPIGVLLTFRFRNCFRPLPVRYERTPSVPGCQYPLTRFPKIARRIYRFIAVLSRRTTSVPSITEVGQRTAAVARQALQRDLPMLLTAQPRGNVRPDGDVSSSRQALAQRAAPSPRPRDQRRAEALQPATM